MDQHTLKKLMAVAEFGQTLLQNPQDLAYWPSKNALAVADDSNGLIIFSLSDKHEVLKQIRECSDSSSVCYDAVQNCVVVSVIRALSQGDDTPGELQFYDNDYKKIKTVAVPREPKIRHGYARWVASDPLEGDLWLASGDNEIAALWHYSVRHDRWKIVWKGKGDLEHPSFIPTSDKNDKNLAMIVTRWTEEENWTIQKWVIDSNKIELIRQKKLEISEKDIAEPWSATVDPETKYIFSYDYKSGAIQTVAPPNYDKAIDVIGMTKAGQWTGIEPHGSYVYVSSSDERCIRKFTKRNY